MLEFCVFLAILTMRVGGQVLADPEFDEDNENWILASRKTIMMKEVPKGANYTIQTYYNSWNKVYEEELAKKEVAREAAPFLDSEFHRFNYSPEIDLYFYVGIRDCGDNMTKMSNFLEHEKHFYENVRTATIIMAVDYCGTPTVMAWCDMGRRLKAYMNASTTLPGTEIPVNARITITCPSTFLASLSFLFHTNNRGPNGEVPHFTWLFYVTFGLFLVGVVSCSGCIFVRMYRQYHENKEANYYRYRYMIPPPMPKKKSQASTTVELEMSERPKRK